MTEENILQITLTALSAIFIYTIGQIIVKLIIEPYKDYKQLIGKIETELLFMRNKYDYEESLLGSNEKISDIKENSNSLRRIAGELQGTYNRMSFKWLLFFSIPGKKKIVSAVSDIIFLSNSLWGTKDFEKVNEAHIKIYNSLNIKSSINYL